MGADSSSLADVEKRNGEVKRPSRADLGSKIEVAALGSIAISRGCFECSGSKKKTCTHRYSHITLAS